MRNNPHDPAPEPERIDDIAFLSGRFNDIGGNLFRRGGQFFRQSHAFGHAGGDKAGLDGHDVHPFCRQAVAQARQKGRESRLGAAVRQR